MAGLRLRAELGGDGAGFEAMMNRANMRVKQFTSGAIAPLKNLIAGAFTVGAITSLTRQTLDFGSKMRDLSSRLGVNVEWLQEMDYAAKQTGGNIQQLTAFIERLAAARNEALGNPKGKQAAAFAQLGVSGGDLKTSPAQSIIDQIAKAFASGNTQALMPALRQIGGEGASAMIAAFNEGVEGLRQQARDVGGVMSEELILKLAALGDQFTVLKQQLLVEFAPAVLATASAVRLAAANIRQSGAGLGGASVVAQRLKAQDFAEMAISLPIYLRSEKGKRLMSDMWKAFSKEAVSVAADQEAAEKDMAATLERLMNSRAANAGAPEEFEAVGAEKAGRRASLPTDGLVGVGNFLGRNYGMVNGIAEQQLQVAQRQLVTLTAIQKTMIELAGKLTGNLTPQLLVPQT